MLHLLIPVLFAQIGGAAADSVYATAALRSMIERAALVNHSGPVSLSGYRARLETEISVLVVDTLGRERTGQIEQLGGVTRWSRDSGYDVHIAGYRTQSAGGFPASLLGILRSWTVPMLYGDRMPVGVEFDLDSNAVVARQGAKLAMLKTVSAMAVHPFAEDREQYYRYAGGDTVAVLHTAQRRVTLIRVVVTPRLPPETSLAAFDGEVDVDAERGEIVRMRGRLVMNPPARRSRLERLVLTTTGTVVVAFVEYVNAEYDGRHWLPATQRFEAQARVAIMGGVRPVLRVTSHFSDFAFADTATASGDLTDAAFRRRTATFAPMDSMSAYAGWRTELGHSTSSVAADDFDDIAPPAWKGGGPPQLTAYPTRPDYIAHYDRIEGMFTGAELSLEMRGAAPGVVARAHGGWAWAEETARGGVSLLAAGRTSRWEAQVDRSLATTGAFRDDRLDGSSSVGAFFGSIEDEDYVDRYTASLANTRILGSLDRAFTTISLAAARDVDVRESLTRGPIVRSPPFRPNRHAATGSYGIAALDYEIHPNVSGEFLDPGFGGTLHLEMARGQLSWVRSVATLSARQYAGPVTLASHVRVGAVFSAAPPPQTLFELGGLGGFGGYRNKQFSGDRAAQFNGAALYDFPILRAPHRIRWFLIPGLSPGIVVGTEGGWTGLSGEAARLAMVDRADGNPQNLSQPSGRVRTSVSAGLTFFAHAFSIGVARSIDQSSWRFVLGGGAGF